jgi:disulfide bond formation protein DsbB
MPSNLAKARLLALLAPAILLGGALASQHIGGLYPCEMCYWQRWPHEAAIVLALLAYGLSGQPRWSRALVVLAAIAIAVSGAIGVFHAGVEYGWWEGLTTCSRGPSAASSEDLLKAIMNAPLIRCDQPQWTLFGISIAGFHFLISTAAPLDVLGQPHQQLIQPCQRLRSHSARLVAQPIGVGQRLERAGAVGDEARGRAAERGLQRLVVQRIVDAFVEGQCLGRHGCAFWLIEIRGWRLEIRD